MRAGYVAKKGWQIRGQNILWHPQTLFNGVSCRIHVHGVDQAKTQVGFQIQAAVFIQQPTLPPGRSVTVGLGGQEVHLAIFPESSFFRRYREKFGRP